jgi:hypothetical protein
MKEWTHSLRVFYIGHSRRTMRFVDAGRSHLTEGEELGLGGAGRAKGFELDDRHGQKCEVVLSDPDPGCQVESHRKIHDYRIGLLTIPREVGSLPLETAFWRRIRQRIPNKFLGEGWFREKPLLGGQDQTPGATCRAAQHHRDSRRGALHHGNRRAGTYPLTQ